MKQISKKDQTAAIYLRLSRDDNLDGESYSIGNQRKLLEKEAKQKGYTIIREFCDDGISGTVENRPDYQKMRSAIKSGAIGAVFVKDLSRLGRNLTVVQEFIELCIDFEDVRIVAVSDAFDSKERVDRMIIALRNVINEGYAEDISKKCRAVHRLKGESGIPLSQPPYGYMKSPDNPRHWTIDEDAAAVVRRIFKMSIGGMGVEQIAVTLENEKILTPINYWKSKGINRGGRQNGKPSRWNSSTVGNILALQEYCGDVVNFKTYTKSYKNRKLYVTPEEDRAVFKNVHEPIIDRATWEKVQAKRGKVRKRKKKTGERNMFCGLLVCADCGTNLAFHKNSVSGIEYFNCQGFNRKNRICPTSHYVRVDFLEQVVLKEIRRLTRFADKYEDVFVKAVMGYSKDAEQFERRRKQQELDRQNRRICEIDTIIQKLYEDNVTGKISDERFVKMSNDYEREQAELNTSTAKLEKELMQESRRADTIDSFIKIVRKYTRVRKLTARMLNELIERIEVYQAEKIDGVYDQTIVIHYHCIGSIEIPDLIPDISIIMNTRKGVNVSYDTAKRAI